MNDLKIPIGKNEFGIDEIVYFEGINSMRHSAKTANIVWIVKQVDEFGEPLQSVRLNQDRVVITPITDENRVTEQGVLIEDVNSPEWSKGIPEYSFWWGMLQQEKLTVILGHAATILNNFNRFDRQ